MSDSDSRFQSPRLGQRRRPAAGDRAGRRSGEVLMLGYMNREALAQTQASGKVTFFSRSKQRLWTKGESSGNVLALKSIRIDCDADTLLVQAEPHGPTCHLGTSSCFGEAVRPPLGFLAELDALVAQRQRERPAGSYTTSCSTAASAASRRRWARKAWRPRSPRWRRTTRSCWANRRTWSSTCRGAARTRAWPGRGRPRAGRPARGTRLSRSIGARQRLRCWPMPPV